MSGMKMTVEERAMEIIALHGIKTGIRDMKLHCRCGWDTPFRGEGGSRAAASAAHRRHVINEMAREGLLVKRVRKRKEGEG